MGKHERWNLLLELLSARERLSVEEAAQELRVSAATVRRDFEELAQQQMLTRTHGGAIANTIAYDLPLRYKSARHTTEKQRIAARVAQLVRRGSIVGMNGGTTTTEVARALATRPDINAEQDGTSTALTLVTNAINIANELTVRPNVKLVVTGGVVRSQSYELVGPLSTGLFDDVTLDVAILGINGIEAVAGATCHNEGEASINRLMATRAQQVIVVADGSKVGHRAFARICGISEVNTFVTDASADPAQLERFEEAGVEVVRV
ncbi:DeoR/GlpR transcriptional regulator [Spiractinospora alimapuensis]|uniref:DeoR/GlpR family DNA-binding transcription regulator n=1 Tax=Spiractinospora alimapuensis TaxID=2820884 RepID=UPI001F2DC8FB|nr:DeoR/GlpR family DNA-binding transcription regulator [Spiractinospora alimapuensis]QVQ53839.1 DeoR/GlpR transcriptional regulator [Spiractinospora alimapuensis]